MCVTDAQFSAVADINQYLDTMLNIFSLFRLSLSLARSPLSPLGLINRMNPVMGSRDHLTYANAKGNLVKRCKSNPKISARNSTLEYTHISV